MGYFEETKLRHIREGAPALITLYSGDIKLQGHVSSIGRAIYDQSVESDSGLIPDIKPNVPWVRLAQRIPVRIEFDALPRMSRWYQVQPAAYPSASVNETAPPDTWQFAVV
jgi:multidrug resistance efflux pump